VPSDEGRLSLADGRISPSWTAIPIVLGSARPICRRCSRASPPSSITAAPAPRRWPLSGAPQVVVPHVYDQHYWARRMHDLGIGTAHASATPTVESLTTALERTLQPEIALRARSIATHVRRDGALVAAQAIVTQV